MTEEEWRSCSEPKPMLAFLHTRTHPSERKFRLFAVHCCRRIWPLVTDGRSRDAVGVAERIADGRMGDAEQDAARRAAADAVVAAVQARQQDPGLPEMYILAARAAVAASGSAGWVDMDAAGAVVAACSLIARNPASGLDRKAELAAQCSFIRDLFGYPPTPSFRPEWLTTTVVSLARGIYDERAFDRMPYLADALQDEGCDCEEVLAHCRGPDRHVRGCWIIDEILGLT